MTPTDKELRDLIAAATPGPWDQRQQHSMLRDEIGARGKAVAVVWVRRMVHEKTTGPMVEPDAEGEANAALIVAMHEALPALLAMARQGEVLRKALAELHEWENFLTAAVGPRSVAAIREDYEATRRAAMGAQP